MSNSSDTSYMKNLIPSLMKERGLDVKKLTRLCRETTQATIYNIEAYEYLDMVSSRVLYEISQALNVSFVDLFEVME